MPKDFDDHRRKKAEATRKEREFILGGEPFTARATVRPEAFAAWDSLNMEEATPTEILKTADDTILQMIEKKDGAHDRYRAVRERDDDDAIGLEDLTDLIQWLVEVQSGRPTEPPSDSGPSPSETGTSSTADSSSPEPEEEQGVSTLGSS